MLDAEILADGPRIDPSDKSFRNPFMLDGDPAAIYRPLPSACRTRSATSWTRSRVIPSRCSTASG
jgi:hypothetical protein